MKLTDETKNYIEYRTICPLPSECIGLEQDDENLEDIVLDLSNQNLEDISFLRKYKNLKVLSLRRNKIKDISVLASLEYLEELDLSYNQIEEFSPLENLKHLKKIAPQKLSRYLANKTQEKNEKWYKEIRNPRIHTSGLLFKKTSVIWDCITFGRYPQDRVSPMKKQVREKLVEVENGDLLYKEERFRKVSRAYFRYQSICWRVLNIKDGKALLFSEKILDTIPFSNHINGKSETTWDNSWIYQWLNSNEKGCFCDVTFSEVEKEAIVNKESVGISLLPYAAISDVRYASYGFWDLYVKGKKVMDSLKMDVASDYAEAKGLKVSKHPIAVRQEVKSAPWWLGTLTKTKNVAHAVDYSGKILPYGIYVTTEGIGVRPIVEVDLTKLNPSEVQITSVMV